MCKGGKKSTSTPVVNQPGLSALNSNIGRATTIADQPFQPYTGTLTAPLSANEQAASNLAPMSYAAGLPQRNAATGGAMDLLNYQPPTAGVTNATPAQLGTAPQYDPSQISRGAIGNVAGGELTAGIAKYMSPYTDDVVNRTLNDLGIARQRQQMQDNQSATASGAFGGNRQGVADSLTNEAYLRQAGDTAAQLRSAGFDTASGLAQSDASRALAAAQGNQAADLSVAGANQNAANTAGQFNTGNILDFLKTNATNDQATGMFNANNANNMAQFNANSDLAGAGVRSGAVGDLGSLGGQDQNSFLAMLNALSQTGATGRGVQQSAADAQYQQFLRMLQQPYLGLNAMNSTLGLPNSTVLGNNQKSTETPGLFGSGGVMGGIGSLLGSAIPGAGTIGGSLLGLL